MTTASRLIDDYLHGARSVQLAEASGANAADAREALEHARRAYWHYRARQAEQELERLALPLVAEIQCCRVAGCSSVAWPGHMFLASFAHKPLPPVSLEGAPVPPIGAGA